MQTFHVLIALIVSLVGNSLLAADTTAASKNVLILLADDLGWGDVGFHGGNIDTPNLDRLAVEGVQLNRFYAYPACSPARAAMLTGRFPQRYGIAGPVRPRDEGLPLDERLLPADFQAAGYATSLIGKWHLGASTDLATHPVRRGFDHFYGFLDASIDYYEHTGSRGQLDWQRDSSPVIERGYSTDLLTDEAVALIERRDQANPFCMVVAYNAPHAPFQAPDDLVNKYVARVGQRDATYAAMVDSMDQGIGRILAAIDQQGLRDKTIVVFASDNGAARAGTNAPLRGQKREVYDGGIRVPCVVRAPGVLRPDTISEQLMSIEDLFPTLAAATGVPIAPRPGQPLDGASVWQNLVTEKLTPRRLVVAENDFAILERNWKLIQATDGSVELYDVTSDECEQYNLAGDRNSIVDALTGELNEFKACVAAGQAFVRDLKSTSFQFDSGIVARASRPHDDIKSGRDASGTEKQHAMTEWVQSNKNTLVVDRDNEATDLDVAQSSTEGGAMAAAALHGDAIYGRLGDPLIESNGFGIRLMSGDDHDKNQQFAGEASITSDHVSPGHRWYRFAISAMALDDFAVTEDDLYLKVEFFDNESGDSLDSITTRIYPQVLRERDDLTDAATNASLGHATWRTYAMEFRTPFAEVNRLKLSVGFANGTGNPDQSEFWVRTMDLTAIATPDDYQPPANASRHFPQPDAESLVSLGGHWYFDPQGGAKTLPKQFDYTNSDQLLYRSDRFEAPFAGNMSSWLRAGYKDFAGNVVEADQAKPYALVITVTKDHIVMRSRNLPNHPTATFPDRWRMLDGNPSYIQEQANTWYLPIHPKIDPTAIAMDAKNSNGALPMGPIGVATNGVIFFNPFDHIFETDAVWRLDRCCGHPSPQSQYHYHKYPVCIKTPWSDEGKMHSSVIGFAFDGFPVYGPYEADGSLAKNDRQNPLNDFNLHEDEVRGPHYHVTPGKFPHLIGGYWGEVDSLNRPNRRR